MPPRSPLELPEIVARVLQHLDNKSLVAATQVNSLWAEEATNWIWRGSYRDSLYSHSLPLRRIANSPKERRDWYTRKIRHLKLRTCDDDDDDGDDGDDFPIQRLLKEKGFHFPNLVSVVVDIGNENMTEEDMARFLQLNLLCLELFAGSYTRWFLEQIQKHAPSLRACLLDNLLALEDPDTPHVTKEDFLNFLQAMPSLKHLELVMGFEPCLTEDVMVYLLLRPGLEKLAIGAETVLTGSVVHKSFDQTNIPDEAIFPHLRSLEITAEDRAVRRIMPLLKNLQILTLSILDCESPTETVRCIASCTRLEGITLSWADGEPVTGASLEHLASHCPMLRRVELEPEADATVDLSDEWFEAIASKLVHLEVLSFRVIRGAISARSLASLARHCPRLRQVEMPPELEILELDDEPDSVRFPSLETLCLGPIAPGVRRLESPEEVERVHERIIALLDWRFPALTTFSFTPVTPQGQRADPLPRKVHRHLSQRGLWLSWSPTLENELTARLIEPVRGSRFNPLS
ncbi:Protein kinase-like domain protein [Rasamsonia emersonii CBS 393.64]|uniref:Protein kinase-like domain protein n=1 Tax=Rasamsonia emersonii (strain ATCC 16479 / CBS 393.64 / IMI 116815) TaxID=1408163 RepID=A0A0F4YE07_RASE3|nr:Protein kinase-like domain protein [Rasamsonia emersonii CBS 393.64]KKA16370.1 Protein kinase-like domain protein [Rasamsonia emersonii CBS 393.64]